MATEPEIQEARGIGAAQAALAAAGVLLLLVVLWFVFLRGDDDSALEETAPVPPPVTQPVEPAEPPDKDGPGKGPVETFDVFAPKDPFKPLLVADGGTGTETPGEPGTGDGDATGDGTGTDDGTGGANGGGGGESVGGHRVSLVDVFRDDDGQHAQVQVDGTVYTVDEGERFAENFQLLSVSGDCATMLFGDDQFTLCEGEEILK